MNALACLRNQVESYAETFELCSLAVCEAEALALGTFKVTFVDESAARKAAAGLDTLGGFRPVA